MGYSFDCSRNSKYKLIATVDHEYGMGSYEFKCNGNVEEISAKSIEEARKKAEELLKKYSEL
jgi:hypothetical protein